MSSLAAPSPPAIVLAWHVYSGWTDNVAKWLKTTDWNLSLLDPQLSSNFQS